MEMRCCNEAVRACTIEKVFLFAFLLTFQNFCSVHHVAKTELFSLVHLLALAWWICSLYLCVWRSLPYEVRCMTAVNWRSFVHQIYQVADNYLMWTWYMRLPFAQEELYQVTEDCLLFASCLNKEKTLNIQCHKVWNFVPSYRWLFSCSGRHWINSCHKAWNYSITLFHSWTAPWSLSSPPVTSKSTRTTSKGREH